MAAARPSLLLSRTSHPASPSRNHIAPQERITTTNGWTEPPLRVPAPSFMDHKGGERVGVLEQMQPLGSFPTPKAKARSRAELARRMAQRDQGENVVVNETSATPDVAPLPADSTGAAAITEPESSTILTPTTPSGMQRASAEVAHQATVVGVPHSLPLASLLATPSSHAADTQSLTSQPQSAMQKGVEKACQVARFRNRSDLEQNVLALQVAATQDPEFATLLKFAMTNNSLQERGSPVLRKIKQLRTTLGTERGRPRGRQSSAIGGGLSPSNTNMSISPSHGNYRTIAPATPTHGNIPQLLPSAISSTLPPSSIRKATIYLDTSPTRIPEAMDLVAKAKPESMQPVSRRSSSSSLSSIDERLASGPPPTLAVPQVPNRSSAVTESLIDDEDADYDARRLSMRKHFDDVIVAESNLRRSSGPDSVSHNASDPPKVFQKLKLNYHNGPSRGSLATPPSEGIVAGSTAALKRPATPTALGRPPKRIKTAAKVKISPQKNQQPAVIAGIARHESRRQGSAGFEGNHSEQSENNDYCSSCGGTGFLLCCDGCDRSFHFTCLDPPLNQNATLDEPWYCHLCHGDRGMSNYSDGLFGELFRRIEKKNPSAFKLPEDLRDYFENVRTGENGEYAEVVVQRTNHAKGRNGYDDAPDYKRLYDAKGNAILCFKCSKSSLGQRDIIPCDHCTAHWHLDCLDPPLANPPSRGQNPKTRPPWMCPLHVDHDLRNLDPLIRNGVRHEGLGRTHRVRRPKHPSIVVPALRRGFKNNGLIEIASDTDDESEAEKEEAPDGTVYRLSAEGIKLDFIEKIKSQRASVIEANIQRRATLAARHARLAYANERKLSEDIAQRRTTERVAALNLAQFASENQSIDLGVTEVEKLIYTLEAEATAEIVASMPEKMPAAAAHPGKKRAPTLPSPPSSSSHLDSQQAEEPNARERELLMRMQEYIARRLGNDRSSRMANGV